jgi:hypothetical protein
MVKEYGGNISPAADPVDFTLTPQCREGAVILKCYLAHILPVYKCLVGSRRRDPSFLTIIRGIPLATKIFLRNLSRSRSMVHCQENELCLHFENIRNQYMFDGPDYPKSLSEEIFNQWLEKGRQSKMSYEFLLVLWDEYESAYRPVYVSRREEIEQQGAKRTSSAREWLVAAYHLYSESRVI